MTQTDALTTINSWWLDGKVNPAFLFKTRRKELKEVISLLDKKRITAVVGPRRTGKTTILYQSINHLLKNKIDPKTVLYFSADDPLITTNFENFGEILNVFVKEINRKDLTSTRTNFYVFIDEIHFLKDWERWVKRYFDQKAPIKFVLSGSSATHLQKKAKESLVGRIEEVFVLPLTFGDFVKFASYFGISDLKPASFSFLDKASLSNWFESSRDCYRFLQSRLLEIKRCEVFAQAIFDTYLLNGGYPEYFENRETVRWQKLLKSDILEKTIYKDITQIYNVRAPAKLEKLMFFIATNEGQTFSDKSAADLLQIDNEAASNYISYLRASFLIGTIPNRILKKNRKLFVWDQGVRNALLKIENLLQQNVGLLVESVTSSHLLEKSQREVLKVSFWRKGQKEVDLILEKPGKLLPIEVKYQSQIRREDFKNLKFFMERFKCPTALLLTKNKLDEIEEEGKTFYLIPTWLFLLAI